MRTAPGDSPLHIERLEKGFLCRPCAAHNSRRAHIRPLLNDANGEKRDSARPGLNVSAKEQARPLPHKGNVLVMDDDVILSRLMIAMLDQLGYRACRVENGEETIERYMRSKAAAEPFAVVILDLHVPRGMGGRDTIKKLLHLDPEVRAIVCSGRSDDPALCNFKEHGFRGALIKPFTYDELRLTLNRVSDGMPG